MSRFLRPLGFALIFLLILGCATYLADFAWLRYRARQAQENAFGQVTIHFYFAVPRKDGKQEFMDDEPRSQSCVKSLYPHSALPPCWYLQRHKDRRIDL